MANQSENSGTKFLRNLIIPTHFRSFFRHDQEVLKETRTVMLVAVTLIAAVTFQAGVTPPGGVWQDNEGHMAGQAIYSSQPVPFHFFLICNTLAFSSSICLLICLTFGYPFFLEVLVATLSMSGTYGAAIFAVTPYETMRFRFIAFVAALPVILRPAIWLLSRMFRKGERLPENQTIGD